MAEICTNRGKKWETIHSLWIISVFFGLGFIAFAVLAIKGKKKKWFIVSALYLITTYIAVITPYTTVGYILIFAIWIAQIVYSFFERKRYLIARDAVLTSRGIVASNVKNDNNRLDLDVPQSSFTIDINKCSAEDIACLPGITIIDAKKAVEYRNKNDGFVSKNEFFAVLQIRDQKMKSISNKLTCGPYVK